MSLWEWLGANSDSITSIVGIVAILLAVLVAWKSPKWQYEAEYKKTIIQDVFPELTSNIRSTIDLYHQFLEGGIFRYGKFPVLFELIKSGQIEYIKIIDETLYNNLIKIKDEIYPLMDELQNERQGLHVILRDKWASRINTFEGAHLDANRFAGDLYGQFNYYLWREEYDKFLETCNYVIDRIANIDDFQPPTDEQLMELRKIAETELKPIKEKIEPIEVKIKEIITDVVIPRLEEIIADPF